MNPWLSTYHTNLKIEDDNDKSASFRISGQIKAADGSPAPFPAHRYHPTTPANKFIYRDDENQIEKVPENAFAKFYGVPTI